MKGVKFYCNGRGCRHYGEPDLCPTAVCFNIKGSNCTHREVYDIINDLQSQHPGFKIHQVQFVPLGVHLDSPGTYNRWVITLDSCESRNRLAGTAFYIKGEKVELRRYDDVIRLEFRKCSRSTLVQSTVLKIKKFDNGIGIACSEF